MVITDPNELSQTVGSREEFGIASRSVHLEDGTSQELKPGTFASLDKFFPEVAAQQDQITYGPDKPIPSELWGAQLQSDLEAFKAAQAEITAPASQPVTPALDTGPGGM